MLKIASSNKKFFFDIFNKLLSYKKIYKRYFAAFGM